MTKPLNNIELELFAVRNKEGQWFRAKGFGASGKSWVNDISSAKIYPKIGPAKSRVSYFAKHYPEYGVPDIVRLTVSSAEVIDQKARVEKAKKAMVKKELKNKERARQMELERAQRRLEEAQADLARLKK